MAKSGIASELANRRCDKCSDNRLYTRMGLYHHRTSVHTDTTITTVNNRQLQFARRSADNLFRCACSKLLTYNAIKKHTLTCKACCDAAAKAQASELISISPIDGAVASTTSSSKSIPNVNRRCEKCNDDRLYTTWGLYYHRHSEHTESAATTVCKKQLRFKRRPKATTFSCACRNSLNATAIHPYPPCCATCKAAVAKARGKAPTSVGHPLEHELADFNSRDDMEVDQREDGDGLLLEPEDLRHVGLVIHQQLKILLCRDCKRIVLPYRVREHLRKEPHRSVPDPGTVKAAAKFARMQNGLLSAEEVSSWINTLLDKQKHGPAMPRVPILPLFEDGFKCSRCGYATINEPNAQRHVKEDGCNAAGTVVLTNVTLQKLGYGGNFGKWIHVDITGQSQGQQTFIPGIDTNKAMKYSMEGDPHVYQPQAAQTCDNKPQHRLPFKKPKDPRKQSEIAQAIGDPYKYVSMESWLIYRLVEIIFETEQQEIAERRRIQQELIHSNKKLPDKGLECLMGWQAINPDGCKRQCVVVAVETISGLIQLNKDKKYSRFLPPSDELRQAVSSFTALMDDMAEIINSNGYSSNGRQGIMSRIDEEDYYTGLFYVVKIIKLLWLAKVGNGSFVPKEIASINDCFEYWAHIALDIHLELQISSQKEYAVLKGEYNELDNGRCRLATDLWWDMLEASEKGAEELQKYLENASKQTSL